MMPAQIACLMLAAVGLAIAATAGMWIIGGYRIFGLWQLVGGVGLLGSGLSMAGALWLLRP